MRPAQPGHEGWCLYRFVVSTVPTKRHNAAEAQNEYCQKKQSVRNVGKGGAMTVPTPISQDINPSDLPES